MGVQSGPMEIMGLNKFSIDPSFWAGKRVFLTGHTGFKGSWLTFWLRQLGAKVCGYSNGQLPSPSLFQILDLENCIEENIIEDICNYNALKIAVNKFQPEIVIHMAAQSLVRKSYINPLETYATNVMGTANLLESVKLASSIRSVVVVTSDKCYKNNEWVWGYREDDMLGGHDPYSSSKACAEIITSAYIDSYFGNIGDKKIGVATARAGNVIGGGDWADDRLVPDMFRAIKNSQELPIRNPMAERPWQHVLEPLSGYLILARALYEEGKTYNGSWNFGPYESDVRSVQEVIIALNSELKVGCNWALDRQKSPHEAGLLKLDCSKASRLLGWRPRLTLEQTVQLVAQWYGQLDAGEDMTKLTGNQIKKFEKIEDEYN